MVGINSNLAASSATRNLGSANSAVSSSIAKLSSGNRIIKASDDVAGLAIGTSIKSTVKSLEIALLNTQQASSVLSIADGALSQIGDILSRQQSIAAQATAGSLGETERGYLNQEFQALVLEIDRIVGSTSFNGITLLNGTLGANAEGLSATAASVTFTVTGTTGSAALGGGAVTISSAANNSTIIGSTAGAEVSAVYNANNVVYFTLNIGGTTYNSGVTDLSTANANVTLTFTNPNAGGGTVSFVLDQYAIPASQGNVNTLAAAISADLQNLTVYQSRTFATTSTGITATALNGTILEGLDGGDFQLVGTGFNTTGNTAPVFGAFSAVAETTTTDGKISVTIGGVTYATRDGDFDGEGNDLNAATLDGGTGIIRLWKDGDNTNTNEYVDIDLTGGASYTSIDFDSVGAANSLASALNAAFGVGSNGALSFQVGAQVSDTIAVSIDSVTTSSIYVDNNGDTQILDITTQQGATDAISILNNAVASVISRRADVGAAQSRFNFAGSNLEISITNQDAARGSFLDSDIATESTTFASAQVRLQASTSVLAQANALPRDLLRLLQ